MKVIIEVKSGVVENVVIASHFPSHLIEVVLVDHDADFGEQIQREFSFNISKENPEEVILGKQGFKLGDRVEFFVESEEVMVPPVKVPRGTIVWYRNNIRIKLDEKAGGRRYVYLGNGWSKV